MLTGVPGVGKTEVARQLVGRCPPRSAWIDTDWLVGITPFQVDDHFRKLLFANLTSCLRNYADWGANVVVVSGVILPAPAGIYDQLRDFADENAEWSWNYFGLKASKKLILQRILTDDKDQDADQRQEGGLGQPRLGRPGSVVATGRKQA